MEPETKHLEFIQGVINRHNSNSFMIKGWAITIVTAILAYASNLKDPAITIISLIPIFIFWILDSIFLANERCFISLYNACINGNKLIVENKNLLKIHRVKNSDNNSIKLDDTKIITVLPYSMNFSQFREIKRNNWCKVAFSTTILWYYLLLFIFSTLLFIRLESKEGTNFFKNKMKPSINKTMIKNKALQDTTIINK